jgi:hypothetical protein
MMRTRTGTLGRGCRVGVMVMALLVLASPASAAPTAVGAPDESLDGSVSIYADSMDAALVHVAPPRFGVLEINQQSLLVDEATCEAAASLNETRRSMVAEAENIQARIEEITAYQRALSDQANTTGMDGQALADLLAPWDAMLDGLRSDRDAANARIDDAAVPRYLLEGGGYYSFAASAPWAAAVSSVASRLDGRNVRPIVTYDAAVYVSVVGPGGFKPTDLVAGVHTSSLDNLAAVVDRMQVDVEPTRLGACFLRFPSIMGTAAAAPPLFGVTVNYTYDLTFTSIVTANYNLRDVYSYLSTSGRSGGLFKSRSWSQVVESRDIDEVMSIRLNFETPVPPDVEEAERRLAREYLLGQAIADMEAQAGAPRDPGRSGATVAADELDRNCGSNRICRGAASAFRVLEGIFGRSGSSSSLTQTLDVTRTYDSTTTETLRVPGSISFVLPPA